jgi:hypothetical protein
MELFHGQVKVVFFKARTMANQIPAATREMIRRGAVIPASPLALDSERRFDERRQRALMRYYLAAGAGGIAVGMHFTQFEIRRPGIDLYEPVLRVCAEEVDACVKRTGRAAAKIAGINGRLPEALKQAETARRLGFDYAIVSMAALDGALEPEMLHHLRELAKVMPLFAFYLPLVVGGIALPQPFWRKVVEIENLHGIKIAPFNVYSTLDVVRAVAESDRSDEITLYTGNDNSIVHDLITPFRFGAGKKARTVYMRGGLLGQWACWTRRAVELLERIHGLVDSGAAIPPELMTLAAQITDANGAIFDLAHGYAGSIPGINEILRRQGLMGGLWTLKRDEVLGPGQLEEIDRVYAAYPHLNDDEFVREHLDEWLK